MSEAYAVDTNAPVVPGKFYKVPCVRYPYFQRIDWWPVLGPLHKDKAFLNFDREHMHVDGRFLTAHQKRFLYSVSFISLEHTLCNAPLNQTTSPPPSGVEMRRRKCTSSGFAYYFADAKPVLAIAAHFAGHQCRTSERGWICPHQATPLGSIEPVDGIIICPLHGLRIDAQTGIVVPSVSAAGKEGE